MEGIIKQLSGFSKIFFSSFLLVVSPWLFFACGLDSYYVLEYAPRVGHTPNYTETDPLGRYFDFSTVHAPYSNMGDFRFLGTYVYYRIYSDSRMMEDNHRYIEAVNNSTNYSAAAERMLGLGYRELYTDKGSQSPLVAKNRYENVRVRIRLTNYGKEPSNDEYNAQIEIGGIVVGVPRRSLGQSYSFDFGRDNAKYDKNLKYDRPKNGDDDFSEGSISENKYYVDMYAVAVGRDTTFRRYYSNVTHLGSVTIDAGSENN